MRFARLVVVGAIIAVGLIPAIAGATGGGVISVNCVWSHTATDDPIVNPGGDAAHEHEFFGARDTHRDSTFTSMRMGGTSCPLSADTAGYWVPSLYKNGVKIKPVRMFAYYRSPSGARVQPFPSDLRIIAGGDTRTPPVPTMVQRSLSWSCVDSGPFFTQPPNCGTGKVRAHVHFPNCLAAGTLDSPDHRAHMRYASGRTCPIGYAMVPKLALHFTYGLSDGTGAVLSSDIVAGTPGGTQLHADFWNTWDQSVLAFLVDRCLNAGASCKQMTNAKLVGLGFGG